MLPVIALAAMNSIETKIVLLSWRNFLDFKTSELGDIAQSLHVRVSGWDPTAGQNAVRVGIRTFFGLPFDLLRAVASGRLTKVVTALKCALWEIIWKKPANPNKVAHLPSYMKARAPFCGLEEGDFVVFDCSLPKDILTKNPGLADVVKRCGKGVAIIGYHGIGAYFTKKFKDRGKHYGFNPGSVMDQFSEIYRLQPATRGFSDLSFHVEVNELVVGALHLQRWWRKTKGQLLECHDKSSAAKGEDDEKECIVILTKANLGLDEGYYERSMKLLVEVLSVLNKRVIIKPHPREDLSILEKLVGDKPDFNLELGLSTALGQADYVISYPSTVIFDVVSAQIPVVAWFPEFAMQMSNFPNEVRVIMAFCEACGVRLLNCEEELMAIFGCEPKERIRRIKPDLGEVDAFSLNRDGISQVAAIFEVETIYDHQ